MSDIKLELQEVFRRVFDDDRLTVNDQTNADEIDGWDSIAHINLIIALEKQFGVKFSTSELAGLQSKGKNVGNLIGLLEEKLR